MVKLADQYTEDRTLTKTMVETTFRRDNVPEDLISEYFECYDRETELGLKIAQWLDENRPIAETSEESEDAT